MEKKLTLEHLVPYLPYGAEVKILNYKCDYVGIKYAKANGFYLIQDELYVTYEGGSTGKSIADFKPILRRLSDMLPEHIKAYGLVKDEDGNWCDEYSADYAESPTAKVPVTYMNTWLFRHHYDIHGLIEYGLAIDVNTL